MKTHKTLKKTQNFSEWQPRKVNWKRVSSKKTHNCDKQIRDQISQNELTLSEKRWWSMNEWKKKKKKALLILLEKNVKKTEFMILTIWEMQWWPSWLNCSTGSLVGLTLSAFRLLWCFMGISGGVEPKSRMWLKWIDSRQPFRGLTVHDFFWWGKTCFIISSYSSGYCLGLWLIAKKEIFWFSKDYLYTFYIHVWCDETR